MATFLQVDRLWINLEQVVSIELTEDLTRPGAYHHATVHLATGAGKLFHEPAEVQVLIEFLTTHRAT